MAILYSFIIAHKNTPALLERCLNSIPERENIEIIVVDDNSDETKKPKTNHSRARIIYLDQKESKWAGHARNIGMKQASGKWLLFPDADDFYLDNFLDVLDQYADKNIDILFFNIDSVDSETLQPTNRNELLQELHKKYDRAKDVLDALKYRMHGNWFKMFQRDFIINNNIFFEEVIKGNDTLFSFLTGYLAQNIAVDHRSLYVLTYHKESMSFTKKRPIESYLCPLESKLKINAFLDFVGHPEWKTKRSMFRNLLGVFGKRGLAMGCQFAIAIVKTARERNLARNKYVELVKNRIK